MKRKKIKKMFIVLPIDERLRYLCEQCRTTPMDLFSQIQKDFLGVPDDERVYELIIAQLLLAENLARNAKVERGAIEIVLDYMRSYHELLKKEEAIPHELSRITQAILQDCNYDKKHTNN